MTIKRIEEFKLTTKWKTDIQNLLCECFPQYPADRIYYKQMPNFRYLVWKDKKLIGHMAVEHRMINVNEQTLQIFGVADLCIAPNFQLQNVASTILSELESIGKKHQIDFIVLTAGDHQFYQKNQFKLVENICRWTLINSNQTLGVGHRRIENSLMVKSLGNKKWKTGLVDFLGHIF